MASPAAFGARAEVWRTLFYSNFDDDRMQKVLLRHLSQFFQSTAWSHWISMQVLSSHSIGADAFYQSLFIFI